MMMMTKTRKVQVKMMKKQQVLKADDANDDIAAGEPMIGDWLSAASRRSS